MTRLPGKIYLGDGISVERNPLDQIILTLKERHQMVLEPETLVALLIFVGKLLLEEGNIEEKKLTSVKEQFSITFRKESYERPENRD